MNINREEIIWAAGFFTGEGCFGWTDHIGKDYRTKNKSRRIATGYVTIAQDYDYEAMERFCKAIGFGAVTFSVRHSKRKIWQQRSFELVQATIALLWPFLTEIKKHDAKYTLIKWNLYWQNQLKNPPIRTGPSSKLSSEDIEFIRLSNLRNKDLSEKFNVSPSHISAIQSGRRCKI